MTALACLTLAALSGQVGDRWGAAHTLCSIKDPQVNESSGLAVSRATPGVFYTHNDSGDTARFFRFDRAGTVTGVFSLKGVTARDWEDMASQVVEGKPYLYLADIGDNGRVHPSIKVYRVPEPTGEGRELAEFETYELTYPDGKHDCEALFVQPKVGAIHLVSKDRGEGTWAYKLPAPKRSGTFVLTRLGRISFEPAGPGGEMVTGADVSPNGRHVVLRTYRDALEFDVTGQFDRWFRAKARRVVTANEAQGEAIAYSIDNKVLLTSTEGVPCVVSAKVLQPNPGPRAQPELP